MKKHTVPNEPEERPVEPQQPEIQQPADPKERELPTKEIEEVPQELPLPTSPGAEPKVI